MDDSSGMTIEFLRARLLSERSVSRSARQRADELEKMVCLKLQDCLECSSFNLVLKELSLSLPLFPTLSFATYKCCFSIQFR